MRELLDAAIDEIERVLIGNKDRNTEEVYLKNAIRHIREYGSQPQLNENQQIVLEWLKLQAPTAKPMQVIFWMMNNAAWGKLDELRKPIMHLTDKQQAQVLEVFSRWAQEQEEKQ